MIHVFAVEVTNWIEDYYEIKHVISLWETEELAEQEAQRMRDREEGPSENEQEFAVQKMPVKNVPVGESCQT